MGNTERSLKGKRESFGVAVTSTCNHASIKDNAMYKVQHKNGKITKVKGWILKNIIASGGYIVAIEEI